MAIPQTEQRRSCFHCLFSLISDGCGASSAGEEEDALDARMNEGDDEAKNNAEVDDMEASEELGGILQVAIGGATHRPDDYERIESLATSNPNIFAKRYKFCEKNDLPAHIVFFVCFAYRYSAPISTIAAILDAYPEAMLLPDGDGDLLIHRVCRNFWRRGDSADIIQCLVERCPKSAFEKDVSSELPLHGLLVMHGLYVPEAIVTMARSHPWFARTTDQNGNLPLLLIVRKPTPQDRNIWQEPIEALIESYPDAVDNVELLRTVWFVDHSWDLRLLIFAHHLSRRDFVVGDATHISFPLSYAIRYPLHAILYVQAMCYGSLVISLSCAIEQFKDRICHVDNINGQLPLHVAFNFGSLGMLVSDIQRLVDLEPRAALVRDPITGLYPFMAMASLDCSQQYGVDESNMEEAEHLNLIYGMFRVECCRDIGKDATTSSV